jgi:CheY-like chemotaxis protein
MGAALNDVALNQPAAGGGLPLAMRLLYIASGPAAGWLLEAFAADRATEVALDLAGGAAEGIARLREEVYDAVLVGHQPGALDALELVEGLRAGGAEEPFIVLGAEGEAEMAALAYEAGADAYLCIETTTTRALLWVVARSIEWRRLVRENRRLLEAERKRLRAEHSEAERLLDQQRALIRDLESLRSCGPVGEACDDEIESDEATSKTLVASSIESATPPADLLASFAANYRELLRAYVIMGSGNLAHDLSDLAESLAAAGVSAPQTIELHVQVLEELVRGLGSRSARHVMSRADLLVLEVIVHLAEGYRRRLDGAERPMRQQLLPGLGDS